MSVQNNLITGFIELTENGYINCLYVHPDWQGKGVGSALLNFVVELATQQLPRLTVDASSVAKPLFLKHGFSVVRENTVHRHQQSLVNYSMQRALQA